MRGSDLEISRQRIDSNGARDVEQDAAAYDGRNRIDRVFFQAAGVRLYAFSLDSAEQFAAAGKMAQGVNVRTHMTAERNRVRRGAGAVGIDIFAVLLNETEQEWGMRRMMRHPREIRLPEIVDFHRQNLRVALNCSTRGL